MISAGLFTKWFNDDRDVEHLISWLGNRTLECVRGQKEDNDYIPINLGNFAKLIFVIEIMLSFALFLLIFEKI